MSEDPRLDDDTSAGAVTQGGDGKATGHSIWWVGLLLVLAVAIGVFAMSEKKSAPTEQGTVPVTSNPS